MVEPQNRGSAQDSETSGAGEPDTAYSGEKARQGEIILRSRRRRLVFFGGLVGLLLLGLLLRLCAGPA